MSYNIEKETSLVDFILEIKKNLSKQKAKKLIQNSKITINGKVIKALPNTILKPGDELDISKVEIIEKKPSRPDKHRPFAIYFEDSHLIIAVKPAGIISAGKTAGNEKTFHKRMEEYLSKRDDNKTRLWAVHRIDREVEGLIVFSKSEKLKEKLSENWSNFTKKYLALTEQKPENENGFIENWLREGENLKVLVSEKETDGSKFAKTEYTFLRTIGKYHLLEIKLHTGRKNQIRVHLAHIGCPIAGDRKYGAMSDFKRKVRLVAFYISFNHPVTEKEITIEYKPADTFYHPSQNADEKYKIF